VSWAHLGTAATAAFLASLVEFVEALTIVLAVGTTRGWRSALTGAAAGALVLVVLTLLLGPQLQRVPLTLLQLVVGILLVLFGMGWLRKAILRAAGVIELHDEAAIFALETNLLAYGTRAARARIDRLAVVTSFKAVVLEGLEVIFIVIAAGADLAAAALGAALAGILVVAAGAVVRRPLARVPENTLKFVVGALLSAFGVFWIGEGLGFPWPGGDFALVALIGGFTIVALVTVEASRTVARSSRAPRQEAL
jgi:uncharacterized membrane protein